MNLVFETHTAAACSSVLHVFAELETESHGSESDLREMSKGGTRGQYYSLLGVMGSLRLRYLF